MTEERKDEIKRKVYYRVIDNMADCFTRYEGAELAFFVGEEMGRVNAYLDAELSKEVEGDTDGNT